MGGLSEGNNAPTKPVDVDAILNRARVNLARSQRLVESWIPLSSEEKERTQEARLQSSNLEDEFLLRPERAGLGADISKLDKQGLTSGMSSSSEIEKLRRQLLGRRATKVFPSQKSAVHGVQGQGRPSASDTAKRQRVASPQSDSDEGGRVSSFKSKRPKVKPASSESVPDLSERTEAADEPLESSTGGAAGSTMSTSKPNEAAEKETETSESNPKSQLRGKGSFLDEILAERSKKKKKKKKHSEGIIRAGD